MGHEGGVCVCVCANVCVGGEIMEDNPTRSPLYREETSGPDELTTEENIDILISLSYRNWKHPPLFPIQWESE